MVRFYFYASEILAYIFKFTVLAPTPPFTGKASNKNLRSAQTLMSIMGKSKPIASAWNQGLAGISRPLGDRGLHGVKEKIDYYLVVGHMCFEFSNNSIKCQSYTAMEK